MERNPSSLSPFGFRFNLSVVRAVSLLNRQETLSHAHFAHGDFAPLVTFSRCESRRLVDLDLAAPKPFPRLLLFPGSSGHPALSEPNMSRPGPF
jgi:hypothetical protein